MSDAAAPLVAQYCAAASDAAPPAVSAVNRLLLELASSPATTLESIIVALGPALTSTDPAQRVRGITLLATLLARLVDLHVPSRSVTHLARFFSERIADSPSTAPCLDGLVALVSHQRLIASEEVDILKALFALPVQRLALKARQGVFRLLTLIMDAHPKSCVRLADDFATGLVAAVDGEKDPRNLLVTFALVRRALELNLASTALVEELLDVVACYYPILFQPSPGDPSSIQRADLVDALDAVFCATPDLARFLIPFLREKLVSSVQQTKLDALASLQKCVRAYGASLEPQLVGDLWAALRAELWQDDASPGAVVHAAALSLWTTLVAVFPVDACAPLDLVLADTKDFVADPIALSRYAPLVSATAAASTAAYTRVAAALATPALDLVAAAASPANAIHPLKVVVGLAVAAASAPAPADDPHYAPLSAALRTALAGRETAAAAAPALARLLTHHPAAQTADRRAAIAALAGVLDSDTTGAFVSVCAAEPELARTVALPLLAEGGHSAVIATLITSSADLPEALVSDAVAVLVARPDAAPRLVEIIESPACASRLAALEAPLDALLARLALPETPAAEVAAWAPVFGVHTRMMGQDRQTAVLERAVRLFVEGDTSSLAGPGPIPASLSVLGADPPSDVKLGEVFVHIVDNVAPAAFVLDAATLTAMVQACAATIPAPAACKALGSIVNRVDPELLDVVMPLVGDLDHPLARAWVAKGLAMRGRAPDAESLVSLSAEGLGIVLGESPAGGILSPASKPRTRVFYRQRLMMALVDQVKDPAALCHMVGNAPVEAVLSDPKATGALVAAMQECLPAQIVPAAAERLARLVVLASASQEASTYPVFEHMAAVVEILLRCALDAENPRVRGIAVFALGTLAKAPAYKVFPFQKQLIDALARAVDDRNRLVRRHAVEARNAWSLFGADS